jgi:hypothetical protein
MPIKPEFDVYSETLEILAMASPPVYILRQKKPIRDGAIPAA